MSEPTVRRKLRWLDLDKPIEYRGRANPAMRGERCVVTAVASGRPRNVRVEFLVPPEFGERTTVVPLGTLRNAKEDGT